MTQLVRAGARPRWQDKVLSTSSLPLNSWGQNVKILFHRWKSWEKYGTEAPENGALDHICRPWLALLQAGESGGYRGQGLKCMPHKSFMGWFTSVSNLSWLASKDGTCCQRTPNGSGSDESEWMGGWPSLQVRLPPLWPPKMILRDAGFPVCLNSLLSCSQPIASHLKPKVTPGPMTTVLLPKGSPHCRS